MKRDTLVLQVGGWAQGQQPRPPKKTQNAKNAQLWKAGRENNRPERVLRNKKENIYLGTWNVLTMLQPGNDLGSMGVKNWKQKVQ
jgi:hypothetical protein